MERAELIGGGLIGLREGLEAAIVVMVLIAFLVKSQRRDALKWVWLGVGGAIAMTLGVFLGIHYGAYNLKDLTAEAVAGVASLLAVGIVTSMVLWMRRAAAGLSGDLRAGMAKALETGGAAVLTLSFLAVGREGFETALFMVGYAEADTAWPLAGLIIGVLLAAAIAWAMYAGMIRINLAVFFTYTGLFLIAVAAGILSYGIGALQTVGWLPGHGNRAFDITAALDWSSWYGQILQGVFNITPTPTVLQLAASLAYLVVVVALFLRAGRSTSTPARSRSRTPAVAALLGVLAAGCAATDSGGKTTEIAVDASDTGCSLSATQSGTGRHTFVVANNGAKVTEFYVYGADDRVLAEAENISPGVRRRLEVDFPGPGVYRTACKPGMTGDGIRADFTVN